MPLQTPCVHSARAVCQPPCQYPNATSCCLPCHVFYLAMPTANRHLPCHTLPTANNANSCLACCAINLQFDAIMLSPSSSSRGRDWSKRSSPNKRARARSPSNSRSRSRSRSGSPLRQRRRHHTSVERSRRSPNARRSHRGSNNKAKGKSGDQVFFQGGTGARGGSACAVCLGRHEHEYAKCSAAKLWNGGKVCVRRNEQGRLVTVDGLPICFSFQTPAGCSETTHPTRHTCSGCGKSGHGAQQCALIQKV